ncbi:zwei Ig domain protein zig-4-like [Ruditapes philippinarum]|uniref:zwei Ig domain protein zig-4-like n=1 Tax=Ruditapes philippinarum TaxID=129788 RepID=UPI00295B9E2F|nr:zwei Ig domain protein zig-4-like [Ruditapes philippinarum]
MNMNQDILVKIFSVILTAMLQLPVTWSFRGMPFSGLDKLMLAKRGETGDWRVSFKGKEFSETTYATRHEDIVLECEAGGSPSPTIHWLKNGERMQQGVSRDYLNDEAKYEESISKASQPMLRLGKVKSKLFLDCVSDRDEAEYACVAETQYERISQITNLKMDNSISTQSRASCLTKKAFRGEPARIYLWTAVRVEFSGAPVQLYCRAEGYPKPEVSWRYSEQGPKIENDENYTVLPNGDLLIKNINFMENMGDYFCTAENESGIDEVSTFLYPTSP